MGAAAVDLAEIGAFEAYVTFWVRESALAGGLERRLLSQLVDWFDNEWAFRRITLGTHTGDDRQHALFRALGFVERWQFPVPGRDSAYVVCVR